MKNELWKIQFDAARNKELSADAFRLLYLICSRWPRTCTEEPFKLSVANAAEWLGYSRESDRTAERAIQGLLKHNFLVKRGCTGSPPTNLFLVSDYRQVTGIKTSQMTGIKSGQMTANHISNSFQEGIEPNGRKVGSLRSAGNEGGKVVAAAPQREMTDAERRQYAAAMRNLKKSLEND